ncbi:ABC transporter family substrate-binding protein [Lentzea tibetensis]|uniref:ABC transporter family substrate-binding protein n=1 Tax=Lentzea tibetensis TaxID=2591470 RepID=A0A563EPC3_9PSEU|nr:ABC transporter family substrate-binding protein [Lentzea tibetensis]TWP49227.1 ABC transporter family substrate-binding protein [Lentzea tibetensis]
MRRLGGVLAAAVFGLAACTNAPPPPLVPDSEVPTIVTTGPKIKEIVLGVDEVKGGYNPHTLAGQSAMTTALSSLLLPSAFRPAQDGAPQLDRTLLVSAQVTKAEPFTVTYTIRRDASWSDSAPIAAEDFAYLSERMRNEPGVVDAAGYRLIQNVGSREGGKVVEVTFAKPFPGWRSLFGNLLPAHLLKDAPGNWSSVLATGFPATAGPFAVRSLDEPRGEVILERSDRYWEAPTTLDRVVLRRSGHQEMADSLKDGDVQAALLRADAIALNLLRPVPGLVTKAVPRNEVVQLLVRPASPQLATSTVRKALVAALDRDTLIAAGTGNGPSAQLRADSLVVPPSRPGYQATIPAGISDKVKAEQLLTSAGYVKTAAGWGKDGKPLQIRIAAQQGVEPYLTVANEAQRQLKAFGIDASVITPNAEELYGRLLVSKLSESEGSVDIAVVPRADGGDSAAALASSFGCVTTPPDGGTAGPVNSTGFCDRSMQPSIEAVLTGKTPLADGLTALEPQLWEQAVALPLFQVADLLAVTPAVSGVDAGAPLAGVLSGAPEWRRLDR